MEKAVSDKGRGSGVGAMTRFIFRHIVRSPLKSLLTLLLAAAFMVGLMVLRVAAIRNEAELERLNATTAVNLEEGGTPLMPELDTSDRDSRKLRIQLIGTRLSVWLDDKLVAEHIAVSGSGAGSVAFTAGVWKESDRYSQTNLYDDVYDAVFVNTQIADVESSANVYYQYRTDDLLSAGDSAQGVVGRVLNFFIENY